MADVEFTMDEWIEQIKKKLASMEDNISAKKDTDKLLRQIGNVVKDNVVTELNRSDKQHVHMKDDVKVSLKSDKVGERYVKISGSNKTNFKWHMLDQGTLNHDGSVHTKATHFMESSVENSKDEIENLTKDFLEKVIENSNKK